MIPVQVPGAPAGLHLIGMVHPAGSGRAQARAQLRVALRAQLAHWLAVDGERVAIASSPGVAPRVLLDAAPLGCGISISHDGNWSFAAFWRGGAVGLDVMRVALTDDWEAVARDYLGPASARRIASTPAAARADAFCRAWTTREAQLKCHGRGLAEWRGDEIEVACYEACCPAGYIGTVALASAGDPSRLA